MKFKVGDYTTAGKLEAKIFMIDPKANYPLIGAIKSPEGWWVTQCWEDNGEAYTEAHEEYESIYDEENDNYINPFDLV